MEQQVKTKVQFSDDYNAFTNLENNDSLSTGFGKMHYDLGYLNSEDQRQESEINAIAQAGSKNICPIGTETHTSQIGFGTEYSFPMPEGAYIISFTGTMVAPIQFNVYSESGTRIALVDIHTIQEAEAGIRFVLNDNATKCKFWYDTSDNYTLSNIMIRDANITDNTFQLYSPTNRELYEGLENKQDNIPDLNTIRSGAAAGATALQQSDVSSTYSASGTAPVNGTAVNAAIGTLDVSSVGGSGKYISAISETGGKIYATPETMDTVPTSGSTKAVTSGGVQAPLAEVVDAGAKNLLKFVSLSQSYRNGVDFTLNSDGSVTVNGTPSGTAPSYVSLMIAPTTAYDAAEFCDGKHIISGCPSGGGVSSYRIQVAKSNYAVYDYGNGAVLSPTTLTGVQIAILIPNGVTVSNLVFKPMICTKAEWDISQAYVPYGKTNAELTAEKTDMIDVYGRGIEIPENADLHTYTTPGVYFSANSARTATLSNIPTDIISAGFRLVVTEESSVDGSRIRHDLYPLGAAYSNFYSENLGPTSTTYPEGWRPWVTYGPITTNPDSATLMNYMAPSAKKFYDDQQRQEIEIGTVANAGAKNLCPKETETSTGSGFTADVEVNIPAGTYILSFTGTLAYTASLSLYRALPHSGNSLASISLSATTGAQSIEFTIAEAAKYIALYHNGSGNSLTNIMIRPAAITDSTFQPYALGNPVLTPAAIKAVDEGAKNIADFTSATKTTYTTATYHGVTITRNGEIFTISGTSDTNDNAFFNIYYEGSTTTKIIPPGNWVALIEDYTGSVVKDIAVQIAAPAVPPAKQYGTPIKFSLSGSESGNWLRVNIRPSTTYNGSFRLMICSQEDYAVSQKFVPYALPNPTLTPAAIKAVDEGAKNLLNCSLTAVKSDSYNSGGSYQFTWNGNVCTSARGVTFTINSDNSIDVVATSVTADVWFRLKQNFQYDIGSYVISGCPSGGSTTTYFIESDKLNTRDTGSSVVIERSSTYTDNIFLVVKAGTTFTGTFKPMICTAADWAVSQKFVPYAPTNRELYDMIQALQNNS